MVKNASDKRVKRSKRVMKEALLSLLREKPIDRITVTELCSEADVNRNTFYAHYGTPEDVLRELEDEQLEQLGAFLPPTALGEDVTVGILRHVAASQDLYRILWSSPTSPFAHRLAEHAIVRVGDAWGQAAADNGIVRDMLPRYLVYGAFAVVQSWLAGGCSMPPEDLARIIDDFAAYGAAGVVRP